MAQVEQRPGSGDLARGPWRAVRDYVAITKPRIIELLLVTAIPSMILAARGWPEPVTAVAVIVGGKAGALQGGGLQWGYLLALGCAFAWSIYSVLSRRFGEGAPRRLMIEAIRHAQALVEITLRLRHARADIAMQVGAAARPMTRKIQLPCPSMPGRRLTMATMKVALIT